MPQFLICSQYNYTADADVGIDDVAEDAVGNVFEDVGTQHRHDEDAEAEARSALDETCTDAQHKYGKNYAAQILNYPNSWSSEGQIEFAQTWPSRDKNQLLLIIGAKVRKIWDF